MREALDTYRIAGVQHNIPFLRAVMDNPRFISGDLSTKFIAEEYPHGFEGYPFTTVQKEILVCAAAVIRYESARRANTISDQLESLSEGVPGNSSMVITVLDKDYDVEFQPAGEDEHGYVSMIIFIISLYFVF